MSIFAPYPLAIAAALTRVQIAAMRKADCVSMHLRDDGTSYISATKRAKPTAADPFATEVVVQIGCAVSVRDYETPCLDAPVTCFAIVFTPSSGEWQSVVDLMRDGDTLALVWGRGAWSNGHLTAQGLAGDTLHLDIVRPNGKRATYLVDHSVGPANCTSRMVRPLHRSALARVA